MSTLESPSTNNKVKHWEVRGVIEMCTGYWIQGATQGEMAIELYKTPENKLLGMGIDKLGGFTFTGFNKKKEVHMVKHYVGMHSVQYDGCYTRPGVIEGRWSIPGSIPGSFYLEKKREESSSPPVDTVTASSYKMTGYYIQDGNKYDMISELVLTNQCKIYGDGKDAINDFSWIGKYEVDGDAMNIEMTKQYINGHCVYYKGELTRESSGKIVIQGSWRIRVNYGEGFLLENAT